MATGGSTLTRLMVAVALVCLWGVSGGSEAPAADDDLMTTVTATSGPNRLSVAGYKGCVEACVWIDYREDPDAWARTPRLNVRCEDGVTFRSSDPAARIAVTVTGQSPWNPIVTRLGQSGVVSLPSLGASGRSLNGALEVTGEGYRSILLLRLNAPVCSDALRPRLPDARRFPVLVASSPHGAVRPVLEAACAEFDPCFPRPGMPVAEVPALKVACDGSFTVSLRGVSAASIGGTPLAQSPSGDGLTGTQSVETDPSGVAEIESELLVDAAGYALLRYRLVLAADCPPPALPLAIPGKSVPASATAALEAATVKLVSRRRSGGRWAEHCTAVKMGNGRSVWYATARHCFDVDVTSIVEYASNRQADFYDITAQGVYEYGLVPRYVSRAVQPVPVSRRSVYEGPEANSDWALVEVESASGWLARVPALPYRALAAPARPGTRVSLFARPAGSLAVRAKGVYLGRTDSFDVVALSPQVSGVDPCLPGASGSFASLPDGALLGPLAQIERIIDDDGSSVAEAYRYSYFAVIQELRARQHLPVSDSELTSRFRLLCKFSAPDRYFAGALERFRKSGPIRVRKTRPIGGGAVELLPARRR